MNTNDMRRSLRLRAFAVGFVLLYALASARSLVPGLCATQAALDQDGGVVVSAYCCTRSPEQPPEHSDGDAPLKAKHPRCAFCQLAMGACTTAPYAADVAVARFTSANAFRYSWFAPAADVPDTNVGRDPPSRRFS